MSRVIRGGDGDPSGRVVPGEVYDAQTRAREIVEQAKRDADAIVQRAHGEADEIRRRAQEAGQQQARGEAAALLQQAGQIRDRALAEAEAETVRIAIAAARHVLREELRLEPSQIRSIVRDVLSRARRARTVTLVVHPDDAQALSSLHAEQGWSLSVDTDPNITRGGCVVHTELGQLDARIEVQLEAIERALIGGVQREDS